MKPSKNRRQSTHTAHLKKAEPRAGSRRRKQDIFLQAFAEHATVSAAAKIAAIGRRTHYLWLDTDVDYAQRFNDVEQDVTEALEAEARRRAQLGVEEPVFHKGKRVDTIRRYSDTLLIFLLKARRPQVYRERFDHEVHHRVSLVELLTPPSDQGASG